MRMFGYGQYLSIHGKMKSEVLRESFDENTNFLNLQPFCSFRITFKIIKLSKVNRIVGKYRYYTSTKFDKKIRLSVHLK